MKLLKPNTVLTLMSATNFDADISYDSDHTVIRHLGEIYSQMIKENLWPKLKVFQCSQHLKANLRSNMSEDEIIDLLCSKKLQNIAKEHLQYLLSALLSEEQKAMFMLKPVSTKLKRFNSDNPAPIIYFNEINDAEAMRDAHPISSNKFNDTCASIRFINGRDALFVMATGENCATSVDDVNSYIKYARNHNMICVTLTCGKFLTGNNIADLDSLILMGNVRQAARFLQFVGRLFRWRKDNDFKSVIVPFEQQALEIIVNLVKSICEVKRRLNPQTNPITSVIEEVCDLFLPCDLDRGLQDGPNAQEFSRNIKNELINISSSADYVTDATFDKDSIKNSKLIDISKKSKTVMSGKADFNGVDKTDLNMQNNGHAKNSNTPVVNNNTSNDKIEHAKIARCIDLVRNVQGITRVWKRINNELAPNNVIELKNVLEDKLKGNNGGLTWSKSLYYIDNYAECLEAIDCVRPGKMEMFFDLVNLKS